MATPCSYCCELSLESALCSPADGGTAHQPSLISLRKSAQEGCPLCAGILTSFETRYPEPNDIDESAPVFFNVWNWMEHDQASSQGSAVIIFYSRPESSARSWSTNLGIYVDEDSPLAISKTVSGRRQAASASSPQCYSLAQRWYEACLRDHQAPCPYADTHRLPTRLISVEDPPRLVVANGARGKWVALSHCWGKEAMYVATTDNLESLKSTIVIEHLPSTFRDAIAVTREMGFTYLWIDSLCILQNSAEDWHHEARKMQTYYKDAALTLAIDCARGDHEGFLSVPRNEDQTLARISARKTPAEPPCTAYIRSWVDYTGRRREPTMLSTRAWTLQEDLLSPRSLHFTSDGLVWECQVHRISERDLSPIGINEGELSEVTKQFFLHPEAARSDSLLAESPHAWQYLEPLRRWYNIVDGYCGRNLTFGKDRLIALDGVAQEIGDQTGFTYADGLWQEDLHFGLLWQIDARGVRPETRRAPSWSWASLDIELDWGQEANPFLQLCYGPYSLNMVHREARADINVVDPELHLKNTTAEAVNADSLMLRIRGLTMPLSSWHDGQGRYFRAYWREPLSYTRALQWKQPFKNDVLICSLDEDVDLEAADEVEENQAPYGVDTSHDDRPQEQTSASQNELDPRPQDSDDEADECHEWDEELLRDILMVQIISGHTYKREADVVSYALLVRPDDDRTDIFRRVGIAEIPSANGLNRKGWIEREIMVS